MGHITNYTYDLSREYYQVLQNKLGLNIILTDNFRCWRYKITIISRNLYPQLFRRGLHISIMRYSTPDSCVNKYKTKHIQQIHISISEIDKIYIAYQCNKQ